MEANFKKGHVVTLKSGSPKMTVTKINKYKNPENPETYIYYYVCTHYIPEKGFTETEEMPEFLLQLAIR